MVDPNAQSAKGVDDISGTACRSNFMERITTMMPTQVKIREVAPRDGFQSVVEFIATGKKLEIIQAVAEAGVKDIEMTSFVSPKSIPQLRDAAEVIEQFRNHGVVRSALVPNFVGAQNAIASGINEIVVVVSATEAHNEANVRRSIERSLSDLDAISNLARETGVAVNGAVAVAFGCPYQGDVPEENVLRVVDAYLQKGAKRIILADTTGMATPIQVDRVVRNFRYRFPDTDLSLHFHNNRGTAMTNLYAALLAGATTFDTALGGIGGCPYVPQAAGNLATEDVVYLLSESGVATGINLEAIIKAAFLLEKTLGYTLPGQVMKSGPRNPELASKLCGFGRH
jgi:hydroxymethylglutaryl-CoA lyase